MQIFLDDNRCKYLSLNSNRNTIEINDNERENIIQKIEEHAQSLEDLRNEENEEEEEEFTKYSKYLSTKRKSITCEEIVTKVNEKFQKQKDRLKEVTGIIEEDEEEEEEEEEEQEEEEEKENEEEEIEKKEGEEGDEDKEEDNTETKEENSSKHSTPSKESTTERSKENLKKYKHYDAKYLEKKLKKSSNINKRDIKVLNLEDLKQDEGNNKKSKNPDQNNGMEKSDSVVSSDSDFHVDEYLKKKNSYFFPWKAIYATEGPWRIRLLSRPLELDIIYKVYKDLKLMHANDKDFMCNNIMAQVLDLAHPSHQLQNLLLTYPLSASNILKKRLLNLGYKLVVPIIQEEINTFTVDTTTYIMSQIIRRVEREMRFYFEITATENSEWRVGKNKNKNKK